MVSEMFKYFLACPGSVIASIVLVTKYARNEGETRDIIEKTGEILTDEFSFHRSVVV